MKAITLHQPYATLIALGDKTVETRDWRPTYRGPLAIHAARQIHEYARTFLAECKAARTCLMRAGYLSIDDLPTGAVVATCQLAGCVSTNSSALSVPGKDRLFGNFAPDRYIWLLRDVIRVEPPVPARGAQQLWEWNNDEAGVPVLVTGRLF